MLRINDILEPKIVQMNDKNLDELKQHIQEDKITWIIGAGASKSVGIPLWTEAILKMWGRILMIDGGESAIEEAKCFRDTHNKLISEIKSKDIFGKKWNKGVDGKDNNDILNEINPLESAEYIINFINEIANNIGETSEDTSQILLKSIVKEVLDAGCNSEDLKKKIHGNIPGILAKYFADRAKKNQLTDVIVYNFDDILEFALEAQGLSENECYIKTPDSSDRLSNLVKISIYHPHGLISIADSNLVEDSESIVLTESSYKRLEEKAYIWENSVQAQALLNTNCVFIGFSGDDYNFRRIIRNMDNTKELDHKKHYFFLSIETFVKNIFKSEIDRTLLGVDSRTEEERERFLEDNKNQREKILKDLLKDEKMIYEKILITKRLYAQYLYWERYGIIPIWTTRGELPEMLKSILEK